jgi:very-short-patch-repair endonuclease
LSYVRRAEGQRGVDTLRAVVEGRSLARTRSEAEERFLGLIRRAGLPMPDVNEMVGRYEVDFVWRNRRLIVEVDGYAYHSSRRAFESDRRRDAEHAAAGFTVVRVTWRQLVHEPERLLVILTRALYGTR